MGLNQLVDKIRTEHPGAYDDMDDATLTKKVLAKYPQYSDLAAPAVPKPDVQMEGMVGSSPTDYAAASPDTALGKAVGVSKDVQTGMGTAIAANDVAGLATAGGAVGGPALAKMATAHPEATKHIAKVLLGLIAGESLGQGHAKSAGIAILTHLLTK